MRKAVTLIELIFTIVIIAAVFTVIPKIIYVSNKTLEFSKKEDAIFNMMSKIMDISLKEYDEMNTKYDDILLTSNDNILECNSTTGYRVGGFAGSRNCFDAVGESVIGSESDEPPYDDVDDYDGIEENTTRSGRVVYKLSIKAGYTDQWSVSDYNDENLSFKFTDTVSSSKSNIKRLYIEISNDDGSISTVSYYSANIGHIKINSVRW